MFLSYKSRHEIFNSISFHFLLTPPQQHSKIVIALYNGPKLEPICINNYEVRLICIATVTRIREVLLIHLVDLEYRLHLADVELVSDGVVEDVQLHDRELEEHLVVLEDLQRVQLVEDAEHVLDVLRDLRPVLVSQFYVDLLTLENPPEGYY